MKKVCLVVLLLGILIVGCGHQHEWVEATCSEAKHCNGCTEIEGEPLGHDWKDATCTEPRTCKRCGETEGDALGHDWEEATCTEPRTCKRCNLVEGEALGHDWEEATCTEPKTCKTCGETEGEPLGHDWKDATCTDSKTCQRCGETDGDPLGHNVEEWTVDVEPTCTEEGTKTGICQNCGETIEEKIAMIEHTPGEWEVQMPATISAGGTMVQKCVVCGAVLNTKSYELTPEEKAQQYKDGCETFTYEQIARDPDAYMYRKAKYTGEIIQVLEGDDGSVTYRMNITKTGSYYVHYEDTILVYMDKESRSSQTRILEDDIVTVYGVNMGLHTYQSIFGASITVPLVYGQYIELR